MNLKKIKTWEKIAFAVLLICAVTVCFAADIL